VASGGDEGIILLWDRKTGRFVRTLVGHASSVMALAFHPHGNRLASAAGDGTVILWDVSGEALWTHTEKESGIIRNGLAFVPDGSGLLAGTTDRRVLRIDPERGAVSASTIVGPAGLTAIAITPSGKRVAGSDDRGHVQLWEVDLSRAGPGLDVGSPITALAFVGSDNLVVTGGQAIQFWDVSTGRLLMTYDVPRGPVSTLKVDPKRGDLCVATQGETIFKINLGDLHRRLSDLALDITGFPF
jgi:WD40 repeat protein